MTANSHLRSTTSSLGALFGCLVPHRLQPVMVFRQPGPWQASLATEGVPSYVTALDVPDRRHPIRAVQLVWPLVRIIRRQNIDVVHCNEHELFPLVRLAARLTRRPTVVTVHFHFEEAMGRWLFSPPYRPAFLQFVSEAVMNDSRPGFGSDVANVGVIPNTLAIDDYLKRTLGWERLRAALGVPEDTVVIGTASAIRPRKRLEDFIELVAALRQRGAPVVGVIAGGAPFADPPYEASLRALIADRSLGDACRMIGNVDPVAPWLRAFDIFVSTSELEPFGMSVCESMACGVPAVGYAAGGVSSVVHDPWCLVSVGDRASLEDKVMALVNDSARRRQMGLAASCYVRTNFDASAVAPRQMAVYEQVLHGRGAGH